MWYFLLAVLAAPDLSTASLAQAKNHLEAYHWLHTHPELSLHEDKTAQFLASELRKLGVDEVHEHVGGYGIVAVLRGHAAGPVVLYRADMDALPVTEATGLPYAS